MKHALRLGAFMYLWVGLSWAVLAQCPTAASYTATSTAATCPSNGTIRVANAADQPLSSGGQGVPGALYQLTSGPAGGGFQTTAQSSNTFAGLPPGNYTVSISKDGCTTVTKTIAVPNQYTQITLTPTVSNVCPGNNQVGATITASVTGGTAPIQYAFIKSPNANIPESQLTYGSTNTFQVTAATGGYGTYQVRARDACGVFVTYSVELAPSSPAAFFTSYSARRVNCSTYELSGQLSTATGSVRPAEYPGYKVEIFDVTGNPPSPCAVPAGATPAVTKIINTQNDLLVQVPSAIRQSVVRTTSPCGEVNVACYDANQVSYLNTLTTANVTPSCRRVNNAAAVVLTLGLYRYVTPIQVTIKNASTGVTLVTDTWTNNTQTTKDYLLASTPNGYQITVTDQCGQTTTLTRYPPTAADGVIVDTDYSLNCVTDLGGKRATIYLSGVATGVKDPGTRIQLISGPSGTYATPIDGQTEEMNGMPGAYWNNLQPGTYTARILTTTTGCGPTQFQFTVPPNSEVPGLVFSLGGNVTALCGGTGTINTDINYNAYEQVSYDLRNASGTVLATNATGQFTNLSPGTYTVRAYFTTYCGGSQQTTAPFTVPTAGQPPVITKKIGVICENGNPQNTVGTISLAFTGFAPYLLELAQSGSSNWTTVASGITGSNYIINNVQAGQDYDIRLTDNCGKSAVTSVSIRPLEALSATNTGQPCVGQNYTLSAPDLPGATYVWSKNGSQISTSREISFTPYQAINDGTYTATVSVGGGCVVRNITVNLNSTQCGNPLPVTLRAFSAKATAQQTVLVEWTTAAELNNDYFVVERSKDLRAFETLARVESHEGSQRGSGYRYTDEQPLSGTSYYRLRQTDLDGSSRTYPAVAVVLGQRAYGVYPNPVMSGQGFNVQLDEPHTAKLELINAAGRHLPLNRGDYHDGLLQLRTPTALPAGVYLLQVKERGLSRSHRLMVK